MNDPKLARKTKIVCTIGPATSSPEMIRRLIEAGMDVARLNFSHGDHKGHGRVIRELRLASEELGREIGILQDLAGPKIRLGEIAETEQWLSPGHEVTLIVGDKSASGELPVNYPYLFEDVQPGNRILLSDGQVELLVTAKRDQKIICQVVVGGVISSHKGLNLPTSELRVPAFTEKDRRDLEFGLEQGVDFVALSFVRHERDLAPLRKILNGLKRPPLLIAKIEKPEALDNLPGIFTSVEGVMVARGDLGVEMPLAEVPIIQKRVIQEARLAGKLVITATQMLSSMQNSPRPTRAEATDVANAVLDGTDAVMLSDETAVGKYPCEAVAVLDQVCLATEPQLNAERFLRRAPSNNPAGTAAAISLAASRLAYDIKPAAIVAATVSGSTARLITRYRPLFPVIGLTPELETCRQMSLYWGVTPVVVKRYADTDEMVELVREWADENNLAGPGDRLILTAGIPVEEPGTTNMLKIIEIPEKD